MKKGLKLIAAAALAAVFCFTLASCNKGTCNTCLKQDVSRHKVTMKTEVLGAKVEKDVYLCNDCYKAYKENK